jgi:hypothetical protein
MEESGRQLGGVHKTSSSPSIMGNSSLGKMGTVEIKLASTSAVGWVDFESAASVAISEVFDAKEHGKRNQ